MVFKTLSIIQAPDGDPEKHRASIRTSTLESTIVVVKLGDVEKALAVARDLVGKESIQALLLCPGFTHEDVARFRQALGGNIAINVARGDVPSVMMTAQILTREGWFPEKH